MHTARLRRIGPLKVVVAGMLLAVAVLAALLLTLVSAEKPAEAAFPGENGKIAFVTYDTSDSVNEIWTMDPDGANRTFLAKGFHPAWSPDGTKIAFVGYRAGEVGGWSDIFVMNADGSDQTNITDNAEGQEYRPTWSPDGTMIAFEMGGVWNMNADGSNPTLLFPDGGEPAWSPDGTKIAITHDPYNQDRIGEGIYTINPDGSGLSMVQDGFGRGSAEAPNWSPDGTKIAFHAYLDGGGGPDSRLIYVMNADGSNAIDLTDYYPGQSYEPVWSPDGTKIAFSDGRSGGSEIYVMNPDGSNQTNITNTADINESDPDWQPVSGPTLPTSKAQCKKGGYEDFGFKNQGRCLAYVQRAADSR